MMHLQLFWKKEKILFAVVTAWFAVVHRLVRWLLRAYWGKGRTVPIIQNPLLLKSATTLAKEIREGKLKSEEVVRAYVERIQEVEPYINATVECVFEDALQKAKEVDALVASGKHTTKQLEEDRPLLGVPISVKVILTVKGLLCTGGSQFFRDVRASEDCPSVFLLKDAGAIVMATTNCSECGLHVEVYNLVHGRTSNPYDTSRTCGGSSGGESALVAAGGSVLGLGNDVLGSIRLPCHITGLFGHKPSRDLVPNGGTFPALDITMSPYQSTGPMCRYAEDLVTSMKILSLPSEQRLHFDKSVNFTEMKICYMLELNDILVSPLEEEISKGLKKTRYGTTSKQVRITSMKNTNLMALHILVSIIKDLKHTITDGKGCHIDERLDLLKYLFGRSTFSLGPLVVMALTKYPFYDKARVPYYQELLDGIVKEFDDMLDEDTVLFFPTFPVSAPYHEEMCTRFPSVGYTGLFNLMGSPVTQCPLGFDKDGLPYGMQIVGRRNNDPLTIACAVELEKEFGGWKPPGRE